MFSKIKSLEIIIITSRECFSSWCTSIRE